MIITDEHPERTNLVKATAEHNAPVPVQTVKISTPAYKPVVQDTSFTAYQNLTTYIEGSPWHVDYYAQVVTTDTELTGHQITQDSAYQPKHRILRFELRVTSALTSQQDEETNEMVLTGQANVFPGVIPNRGDMFLADIGEGRKGLFKVTGSVKKSVMSLSAYEITYHIVTDVQNVITNLNQAVVLTSVFERDFLRFGQSPLVVEQKYATLMQVHELIEQLSKTYFRKFFANEFSTYVVPSVSLDTPAIYDPFLVQFLQAHWDPQDAVQLMQMRVLAVDDDPFMKATSLWTAITERSGFPMNEAFREYGLMNTGYFTMNPSYDGIRYSGIPFVVYPAAPVLSIDSMLIASTKTMSSQLLLPSPVGLLGQQATVVQGEGVDSTVNVQTLIKPVTVDNHYVLSQAFYEDTEEQSVLEGMVWQYLRRQAIDTAKLVQMARQYTRWGVLEQFYYIPIVLQLLRQARWTN